MAMTLLPKTTNQTQTKHHMKKKQIQQTLTTALAMALSITTASAAVTEVSSNFTGSASAVSVDTTGANIVDWGYYDERTTFVADPNPDNSMSGSTIGFSITAGAVGNANTQDLPFYDLPANNYTFDNGTSLVSGTQPGGTGALFGNFGTTESNGFTIDFTNFGAGDHIVTIYAGHVERNDINSAPSRDLRMDYLITDVDGNASGLSDTGTVAGRTNNGTYTLAFTTTDANASLSLTLDSVSGDAGSGFISGYTFETVPEPSSTALLGLGGLALILRRRR